MAVAVVTFLPVPMTIIMQNAVAMTLEEEMIDVRLRHRAAVVGVADIV